MHGKCGGADTVNLYATCLKEGTHFLHLVIRGRVLDDGCRGGERGGHERVFGYCVTGLVENNLGWLLRCHGDFEIGIRGLDVDAKVFERVEVRAYGATSELAPTRLGERKGV